MNCDHLKQVKETYVQHAKEALLLSARALYASVILLIHALIPCLFIDKGTDELLKLGRLASKRREKQLAKNRR